MKAKVNLNLDCVVCEHGTILVPLFIVCAFRNENGECVELDYFIDEEKAIDYLDFSKRTCGRLFHNFWIKTSQFIQL